MRAKCKNNHLIQYILVFLVWYIHVVYKVGFSRFSVHSFRGMGAIHTVLTVMRR